MLLEHGRSYSLTDVLVFWDRPGGPDDPMGPLVIPRYYIVPDLIESRRKDYRGTTNTRQVMSPKLTIDGIALQCSFKENSTTILCSQKPKDDVRAWHFRDL
jgi:hypothetical protein